MVYAKMKMTILGIWEQNLPFGKIHRIINVVIAA
jgi:hypothetical protein